jgi:hypothetical protein
VSIMPPPGQGLFPTPSQPMGGGQPQFTPPPSVNPAAAVGGGPTQGAAPPMSNGVESPEPDTTSSLDEAPRRRRRSLKLDDDDDAADDVIEQVQRAKDERIQWMDQRLVRYAKLRGWRQEQTWPWDGAHNEHVPLMMSNSLRIQAGLFNAVMGNKPMMQGRSLRRDKVDQADKASNLIEFQLMQEADGEQKISQAIQQFCDDGMVISFQPWVKDSRKMVDVRVVPAPPAGQHLSMYLINLLPEIIGPSLKGLKDETMDGYNWTAQWEDPEGKVQDAEIEVWDRDDDKLDVEMRWEQVTFDGPTFIIHQLEDIVVPLRSLNLQPVTPHNPFGAPWVARRLRVNLDTVLKRIKNGTYDLLTWQGDDNDYDTLVGFAKSRTQPDITQNEDSVKIEKESKAGLAADWSGIEEEYKWIDLIEWYGAKELADGYECEVVMHVFDVPGGMLARARYLSEVCPGSPQWRPFAEERFIPVADSFYGISVPEVLEGLHDLLHELFNANLDRGDIANLPVMLYRASSGVKPEEMRARPGDWIPVDDPSKDAVPVQYPHADQSWSFNMIGLVQQLAEKVIQVGALQMGQVPQGKASALRTVGTTMAILQQGAALPEQILRRFFHWLQQVYGQFHMLNMKFLPERKRYLIAGKDPDTDAAYAEVSPQELQLPVNFEFGATLLNTNKGVMSQALQSIGAAIFNPLGFQTGVATPQKFYQYLKDYVNASQLDPLRYVEKPQGTPDTPMMTANDAIAILTAGQMPNGTYFAEGATQAFQTLQQWAMSPALEELHISNVGLVKGYLMQVQQAASAEAQKQAAMQASQQFQQQQGQQGQGQGSGMSGGAPPEMQTEAPTQQEIQGGGQHA